MSARSATARPREYISARRTITGPLLPSAYATPALASITPEQWKLASVRESQRAPTILSEEEKARARTESGFSLTKEEIDRMIEEEKKRLRVLQAAKSALEEKKYDRWESDYDHWHGGHHGFHTSHRGSWSPRSIRFGHFPRSPRSFAVISPRHGFHHGW